MVGNSNNKITGKHVFIQSSMNASKRTKNRVRENGPYFICESEITDLPLFGGDSVFLKSKKTNWMGWIPFNEITME